MIGSIEIPYHFVYVIIISISISYMVYKRFFNKGNTYSMWKWKCFFMFLIIYTLLVTYGLIIDISYQIELNKYDLNGNGIFEKNEQIGGQQEALLKLSSDVGRNLLILTGLFISLMISFFIYILGLILKKHS